MKQDFKKLTDEVNLSVRESIEETQQSQKRLTREEIRRIMEEEKKMGLSTRCEWCPENIFCEAYLNHVKKNPNEILRCDDFHSGR